MTSHLHEADALLNNVRFRVATGSRFGQTRLQSYGRSILIDTGLARGVRSPARQIEDAGLDRVVIGHMIVQDDI